VGISPFGTMGYGNPDYAALEPASQHKKIEYPKPDSVLTFAGCLRCFCPTPITRKTSRCICSSRIPALQKTSELEAMAGRPIAIARQASVNG
jgi:electron-transferring-flavoprotein dehydrogenase